MLAGFLDAIFNGISIGAVLLIAALGLAIVFGLMGVINMAHGELMMLGAYTTFVVQNFSKQLGGLWFESYIFFALIFAFLITAIVGLFLEQGVVRYLYNRPLETLLATWGVSLILQQFVRSVNWVLVIGVALFCLLFFGGLWILNSRANFGRVRNWIVTVILLLSLGVTIAVSNFLSATYQLAVTQPWFGAQNVDVTAPGWLRGGMSLGGVQLPFARLFIIALTVICVVGIYLFLQRSNWGLRIRAVTQNRSMSACLGIPTQKVDAMTFALGSGLAGVAGCAISLLGSVGPNTGQNYIIDTFMVVVVGGVGNLVGSIVAALAIGTVNFLIGSGTLALLLTPVQPLADLFTFFATTSMARVMVFALIIAFLQWKPAGIFPQKGRTVDV
ncbi:ABC transporter permease subunit [Fischerella thermalis]|uniref:Urea ABC transporter, permease protein UrtB n=1 Tax=Fischerella thermalis JSC-11 TaxID=741277 RepID=G6G093_9CYAN|nr:branched-chain amino acid ABC transporter permease [Fischerella thermalis]PLZ95956.1 branched-chain amino acid ABC transporter permease [Fischerella thermalis CCMEE 5328]EHC08432.1 urea ABC transporter, permease protein UrtB [Fischerella thermalis JSC-11]PLZ06276.1 branched-chain amino acid ABC transporter permease [Fischerella thermalis WC1110]PLZ12828.1 branched-chain amino acid ABC transporter permease [Fischerella thermalis WC114]PLZ14365.1 branched-chain amino acid ABC transporter perm